MAQRFLWCGSLQRGHKQFYGRHVRGEDGQENKSPEGVPTSVQGRKYGSQQPYSSHKVRRDAKGFLVNGNGIERLDGIDEKPKK